MSAINGSNSISITPTTNQAILNVINIMLSIYYIIIAFYNPVVIFVASVNNALILYVLIRSKLFYEKTSKTVSFLY